MKKTKFSKRNLLINNIIFKFKFIEAKKFAINHLIPILFFLLISIFIFRGIIGNDGIIVEGDFIYPPDLNRFYHNFFYPIWDANTSTSTIQSLPRLMIYLPFYTISSLLKMDTTQMMILVFIFYEFLAGISMYYASGYILKKSYLKNNNKIITKKKIRYSIFKKYFINLSVNPAEKIHRESPNCDDKSIYRFPEDQMVSNFYTIKIASFIAGLTYMWSYFLIFNFKYLHHKAAYALAPLIILFLIIGLENKKIKYIILTGFLWSVACADMHWTIDGAILLISFIGFCFIVDIVKINPNEKLKAFKKSLFFHLKYLITLLGSFICFSAYWFLPGFLMGGTSRYSAIMHTEYLELTNSQSTILNVLTKQASFFQPDVIYSTSLEIFSTSIIQNLLILLGLIVFIIGIAAVILKPRNKYVLFFAIFLLISIFLVTMVNLSLDFGLWVITKAPLHQIYGWAFKWGIISQFVIFSLCFLLGFSIVEILIRIKKSKLKTNKLKKGIPILIICVLLTSVLLPKWPLATGDLNGWLKPVEMPDKFAQVNSWLEDQEGDFKVLWIPNYRSIDVTWYQDHKINKDIAGYSSSKPTYVFFDLQKQPNGYGMFFLYYSGVDPLFIDTPLYSNATKNLGKLFAPLGVKYFLFHYDNAAIGGRNDVLLNNTMYQEDLELVKTFGFIYVFENKYYDEQNSYKFFTTSNNFLVSSGLASITSLNHLPEFHSRTNSLIFSNQKQYDTEKLNIITDGIIFTKSSDLEEIASIFFDDKYIIAPFDYSDHFIPDQLWSKNRVVNFGNIKAHVLYNLEEWDWDYDKGLVYTWSPGYLKLDTSVTDEDLIDHRIFETGYDGFSCSSSLLTISQSFESAIGKGSLMGIIAQGEPQQKQNASTDLIPVPKRSMDYRISFYLATENANNVQVGLKFFDAEKKYINQNLVLTVNGSSTFEKFEQDIRFPTNTKYYTIQILADQNPISESYWWIDDIRLYDLRNCIEPNKLEMKFDVDQTVYYDLFVRYLNSEGGGKIDIYLDDILIESINTINKSNALNWEKFKSFWLKQGSHKLIIENVDGFNAVNLIAFIPKNKTQEYFEKAEEFLKDKCLIYCLEPESDFYFENATISSLYGNTVSSGKILKLTDSGVAWLPVKILKPGNYSMLIRYGGGTLNYTINLTFGDIYQNLRFNNESYFTLINVTNISLNKGNHNLKFTVVPTNIVSKLSFDEGWNSTSKTPEPWSAPQSQFTASIDTLNRIDGKYSLKLITNSTEINRWSQISSQEITVEPNHYYRANINIKTENVNNTQVVINGYNRYTDDWQLLGYITKDLSKTNNWEEYSSSFFVSEDIYKIKITLNAGWVLDPLAGNAVTWFDNFKLFYDSKEKNNYIIDSVLLYLNENNQTLDDFFKSNNKTTISDYQKIDSTKYKIKISSTEPFMLGFAEAYDDFWIAHVEDDSIEVESIPIYAMLNGFYINKTGNITVIIEYKPQKWFNIGVVITGLSLIIGIGYFILSSRKKEKKLVDSLKKVIRIRWNKKENK